MNKEEIKAVLAIINRQCFVGVNREAIENHLEYRLLRSAATKLERMLLDIESGYNKLVNAENARNFERTKVLGSEDGPYHAVYNQARGCWDLMFLDVLCTSFYVGRYPCAEDKVAAEVSRLNAEYRKEAK